MLKPAQLPFAFFSPDEFHRPAANPVPTNDVRFNLRASSDPEHKGCYLSLGHDQSLATCGFNMTAKTFFVLHGWSVRSRGRAHICFPPDLLSFVWVPGKESRGSHISHSLPSCGLLVFQTAVKDVMGPSWRGRLDPSRVVFNAGTQHAFRKGLSGVPGPSSSGS